MEVFTEPRLFFFWRQRKSNLREFSFRDHHLLRVHTNHVSLKVLEQPSETSRGSIAACTLVKHQVSNEYAVVLLLLLLRVWRGVKRPNG